MSPIAEYTVAFERPIYIYTFQWGPPAAREGWREARVFLHLPNYRFRAGVGKFVCIPLTSDV